ncbi:inositol monophosphatase [Brachybacterium sp. YJGR34]|uniref:inositol monophosphatase family protein n=1 Tax=Brachybacterium sp. YJGR34 TaxID=2059911 RepID=UPI000E0BA240|nr:inositol monophosphatase [Brachybacterium sp. YJGR34]
MNTSAPSVPVPSAARLLEIATSAAHAAAEYLRSLDRDHLAREYKTSSHDIVTEHDRASEEIIVAELRRRLPSARIVGEEGGVRAAEGPAAESDGPVVSFYVDPIDGTSNFAAGLPLFCVSIGVSVDDELVAGVIDAPILGQVFAAADGAATLNGRPLAPRATRPAADALVVSGFPGHTIGREFPEFAGRAAVELGEGVSSVRHLGTAALELAYVAAGWADATALGRINSWDVAAGFHILRRAGGSIRTWPGTGDAQRPDHLQPAYVACTGPERLEILDALQDELQALRVPAV